MYAMERRGCFVANKIKDSSLNLVKNGPSIVRQYAKYATNKKKYILDTKEVGNKSLPCQEHEMKNS